VLRAAAGGFDQPLPSDMEGIMLEHLVLRELQSYIHYSGTGSLGCAKAAIRRATAAQSGSNQPGTTKPSGTQLGFESLPGMGMTQRSSVSAEMMAMSVAPEPST
jgi:hypothetical protein